MPIDGVQIVDSSVIRDERVRYMQIWEAVRLLSTLPPGKAVSVEVGKHPAYLIIKKAHVYAKRYQLKIMAKTFEGKVFICERRNERKASMGDLAKRCMQNASDRFIKLEGAV